MLDVEARNRGNAARSFSPWGHHQNHASRDHGCWTRARLDSVRLAWRPSRRPGAGSTCSSGLHDELRGTAYALIEGIHGRTHHLIFSDLEVTGDAKPGAVVEMRAYEDSQGRKRSSLATRSDLTIEAQVTAPGATWIDRQLLAKEATFSGSGFGAAAREAMDRRLEHLAGEGLVSRQGQRVIFARDLLDTLRKRDLTPPRSFPPRQGLPTVRRSRASTSPVSTSRRPSSGGGTPTTRTRPLSSSRAPILRLPAALSQSRPLSECRYGGHARRRSPQRMARPAGRLHLRSVSLASSRRTASCSDGSITTTCATMARNMYCASRRPGPARASVWWCRPC
jgi:hypothetical protein